MMIIVIIVIGLLAIYAVNVGEDDKTDNTSTGNCGYTPPLPSTRFEMAHKEAESIEKNLQMHRRRLAEAKAKGQFTGGIEASIRACEQGLVNAMAEMEKYK